MLSSLEEAILLACTHKTITPHGLKHLLEPTPFHSNITTIHHTLKALITKHLLTKPTHAHYRTTPQGTTLLTYLHTVRYDLLFHQPITPQPPSPIHEKIL
jgi:hypothetical protein